MKRKALIVYCDDTRSGSLVGPPHDNSNFRQFLKSNLGGSWYNEEIISLRNPSSHEVTYCIEANLKDVDYSFTIFTGHGFINTDHNNLQYIELSDGDVSVLHLRNYAPKQTIIVDACRGYYSPSGKISQKLLTDSYRYFANEVQPTRKIFEDAVSIAEKGLSILFAASEDESALDTDDGAAYLLSLLSASEVWKKRDSGNILALNFAHEGAKQYLYQNFTTNQKPTMAQEKRLRYFPFAVKMSRLNG